MKRSPLGPGSKSLSRGSTFAKRGAPLKRSRMKRKSESWRTPEIDAKMEQAEQCRNCPAPATDPHHAVPRALNPAGRKEALNILPLCRPCHDFFTAGGPLPRSVFTAEEWALVSTLAGPGWLARRYPAERHSRELQASDFQSEVLSAEGGGER